MEASHCQVCSRPLQQSPRRYGGNCCNACAVFFLRNAQNFQKYHCKRVNKCLILPTKTGSKCRRCRFQKCLEIGMEIPKHLMVPRNPSPMDISEGSSRTSSVDTTVSEAPDYKFFATKVHCLIKSSVSRPDLLIGYLENDNAALLNMALEASDQSDVTITKCIAGIISCDQLSTTELPYLCYLIACGIEITNLNDSYHHVLVKLQQRQYTKYFVDENTLPPESLTKLLKLSKLCLSCY